MVVLHLRSSGIAYLHGQCCLPPVEPILLSIEYQGPAVYDDPEFSRKYLAKREKEDNPNDALEKPVILDLIGKVEGKTVLDLGCGDGLFGRELLDAGAIAYRGVDGSETMAQLASENLEGYPAIIERADLKNWSFPDKKFDLILSRLVLHYLEDLDQLFKTIHNHLTENGHFIFSVEHPVMTSCYDAYNHRETTKRSSWIVDNYFEQGARENIWIGKKVIKYHKTLETYFHLCRDAGFTIESIRESTPQRQNFRREENFERRKRIPLFLFFKLGVYGARDTVYGARDGGSF